MARVGLELGPRRSKFIKRKFMKHELPQDQGLKEDG